MSGLLGRASLGWRGVPVGLRSPLPVAEARRRLAAVEGDRFSSDWTEGRRVYGHVGAGHVRLSVGSRWSRNVVRPVATCRLEPDGAGCRLVGRLQAPMPVRVLAVAWIGLVGLVLAYDLVGALVLLIADGPGKAATPAVTAAVLAGVVVVSLLFFGVSFAFARREGEYLLGRLAEMLDVVR